MQLNNNNDNNNNNNNNNNIKIIIFIFLIIMKFIKTSQLLLTRLRRLKERLSIYQIITFNILKKREGKKKRFDKP